MPSYLLPSSGLNLLCLRPLELRTTLTGLPAFQSRASAPSFSLTAALQLRARALGNTTVGLGPSLYGEVQVGWICQTVVRC